jgi:hypothetical protein
MRGRYVPCVRRGQIAQHRYCIMFSFRGSLLNVTYRIRGMYNGLSRVSATPTYCMRIRYMNILLLA